jgi:hypothetical protein
VLEVSEIGDVTPTAAAVSARTTVQVVDVSGAIADIESGLAFTATPGTLEFHAEPLLLTSGTARDAGNGVLDVREGDTIRVLYQDTTGTRTSEARVACTPNLASGGVTIEQFGQDAMYRIHGGCERSVRGLFEFGFPDRYLDAGELVTIEIALAAQETAGLDGAEIDLRCVIPDADSPAGCVPTAGTCPDPYRANNPSCDQRPSENPGDLQYLSIHDTPRVASRIPPDTALTLSFPVAMAASIPGTPEVELVLSVVGNNGGRTTPGLVISRQRLDVDEQSKLYSTDFPTGGTEQVDVNNNETLENPTTDLAAWSNDDYRFETRVWSDLTAGGTKNTALLAPWNFDTNDGGFRSGIVATTSYATITNVISQWGEDLNFNNVLDPNEDRDPVNGVLDRSWNIKGGCGWQTRPPATCSNDSSKGCFSNADCTGGATCTGAATTGGIWHTGRIGLIAGNCLVTGNDPGQCQVYETVAGTQGLRSWREALVTPVIRKVNGSDHRVEILQWAWNQAVELEDNNAAWGWEFDTDTSKLEPVDLYSDSVTLNALFGPYGAVGKANNPRLTNGYGMFAPLTANMQTSTNGSLGNNRQGKNACFFENGAVIAGAGGPCPGCPSAPGEMGWARPLDDDLDNDTDGLVDEYVRPNGPIRNMDLFAVNGPDMRFYKLEDLYGDTGETFQAALTMMTFEKTPAEQDPRTSYGLGVDDMVIEWREYTLVDDAASCGGGQCASISLDTNVLFEGSTSLTVTVTEKTPRPINDCDLDGLTEGTVDCNGNGIRDVVARVTSVSEFAGEVVVLDAAGDPAVFRGELSLSTVLAGPGILFVGIGGHNAPQVETVVTASYEDLDDGTGAPCGNSIDPALRGRVEAQLKVYLRTGEISVIDTLVTDNGDHDAFADTNETVEVRLRIFNHGDTDLTGVTAHVVTHDPKIDCVLRRAIYVGDVPANSVKTTSEGAVLRVAGVDRTASGLSSFDEFAATFYVGFTADQFDFNESTSVFALDLDLDAGGGSGSTTFFEGFESATFGAFEAHNIDAGLSSLAGSNGYRCQYHDPDWPNSNSYGQITDCFLGANAAHASEFYWRINKPTDSNLGKAFSGNHSLYMGVFGPTPDYQTTPMAVLEAVRLANPINLAATGPPSELSYKQQVDLVDSRVVSAPPGDALARYVTMLQLADDAGNPVGDWLKLEPYLNVYDQTGVDNYFNCMFDPIDDGNDEDDFFDPTDPDRRMGPSSTCKPELNFAYIGHTFLPYDGMPSWITPAEWERYRLGNASDGPALRGSLGVGAWVESRFSLERFRGRRARLRFLNTDIKINGTYTTWASRFTTLNPGPGDDGIWIDDVEVTNTLVQPATMTSDTKPNAGLPACGNTCNVVTAKLAADPPGSLLAPGQVVELDAFDSAADRCIDGELQFRFWIDGDGDGLGGGVQDVQLRGWSETSMLVQAPSETTRYLVEVRCSSDPNCSDSEARTVVVACPTSGNLTFPEVLAPSKGTLAWGSSRLFDYAKGLLHDLSSYTTTVTGQAVGPSSWLSIAGDVLPAGKGMWYVFRDTGPLGQGATGYCNAPGITWGSAQRDAALP